MSDGVLSLSTVAFSRKRNTLELKHLSINVCIYVFALKKKKKKHKLCT